MLHEFRPSLEGLFCFCVGDHRVNAYAKHFFLHFEHSHRSPSIPKGAALFPKILPHFFARRVPFIILAKFYLTGKPQDFKSCPAVDGIKAPQ
jgi:hypothetical protein